MRVYSSDETAERLPYPALLDALAAAYAEGLEAPLRHHHTMPKEGEPDATLLLMPAWGPRIGGVKIVNVTPGNGARGLPAIMASYLVFSAETGRHEAILDGAVLTARRTAAQGALGARLLARPDSRHLLVVGAGRVAEELPAAFAAALPIERVTVWNRNPEGARRLAERLSAEGWQAGASDDLEAAVGEADVISCATLSEEPLIRGAWLKPGQHLDLIGSFTPAMREADDEAVRRARVYVDCEGARVESGDIRAPLESGALAEADILGTFYDLCSGAPPARGTEDITLFKGVGNAVADLAAAGVALASGD